MRENREESLIAKTFSKKGYSILKEPDGNVPPDIVLDKTIAVEVTRLSKVLEVEGLKKSIDNDASSIIAKLKKSINTCNIHDFKNYKYSVLVTIKRPFGNLKKVMSEIKSKLQEIEDNGFLGESVRFTLSPFFSIKVCKRNVKDGSGFLLTSIIDLDSNYCDQEVMLRSVVFCHNTKKNKIKPFLERYKEWWLVLSDTITYDGSVEYREYLASNLCKTPFSRIIFVNSLNGDIVLEI